MIADVNMKIKEWGDNKYMKEFNTTAVCVSNKHYMVDITERVNEIKRLVDAGKYFTINRARQYGKTTTLTALRVSSYTPEICFYSTLITEIRRSAKWLDCWESYRGVVRV